MNPKLIAIRGAIQVTEDTREAIIKAVLELYDTICETNALQEEHMVSLMFSVTFDLQSLNPATALRSRNASFNVPLFCMQEPTITGMLPRTIRLMVNYYGNEEQKPTHIYLHGAARLRPDLSAL